MRRISSIYSYWLKRAFPLLWLGFIIIFMGTAFFLSVRHDQPYALIIFLPVPLFMAIVGYCLMRKLVFDLAEEVLDAGDSLEVRNRGRVVHVPLADIVNVDSLPSRNPPRVVLTLQIDTPLGRKIAFSPKRPLTLNPFATIPVIDDLIERVDQARRARGR